LHDLLRKWKIGLSTNKDLKILFGITTYFKMKTTTLPNYLWIAIQKKITPIFIVLTIFFIVPNLLQAQITMHPGFPVTYSNMATPNPIFSEEINSNYEGKEVIFISSAIDGVTGTFTKLICLSQTGVLIFERNLSNISCSFTSIKPVVADIDNNGTKEIICSYTTSINNQAKTCVNIFTYDGNDYGNGWPKVSNLPFHESPVSVGDIDNDGDLEIAFIWNWSSFQVFHHDGSFVTGWPKNMNVPEISEQFSVPCIADFNGDGNKDILFATNSTNSNSGKGHIWLYNGDGSLFQNFPITLASTFAYSSPVGVDLYDGINRELEIMATDEQIYKQTNVELFKCNGCSAPNFPITVPNIGGDAPPDNTVLRVDENGEPLEPLYTTNGSQPVTFADLDQNGDIEFIITGDNEIHIYNHDGTLYANFSQFSIPNEKIFSPVVADVDGDGQLDIIFTSWNSTTRTFSLHIKGKYGNYLLGTPKVIKQITNCADPTLDRLSGYASPTIDDIDGDGKLEILVGTPYNGNQTEPFGDVSVFDLLDNSPRESIEWGMVYKNMWSNNLYFDPIKGSLPEGKAYKWYDHICMIDNTTLPVNSSINVLTGTRISSKNNSSLEIKGAFNIGSNCVFRTMDQNSDLWQLKYNAPSNYSMQDQKFIRTNITGYSNTLNITSCNFENSTVTCSPLQSIMLNNSIFNNSLNNASIKVVASKNPESNFNVTGCQFNNGTAISITSFPLFTIQDNTITNITGNGIELYYCGTSAGLNHKISNNNIQYTGSSPYPYVGIRAYRSYADLELNKISGYYEGLECLNYSNIRLIGNSSATTSDETQKIFNNYNRQVFSEYTSFPFVFNWNAIVDNSTSTNPLVEIVYKNGIPLKPVAHVENNYWGNGFNPSNDLIPAPIYLYQPIWDLPGKGSAGADPGKDEFDQATEKIIANNFTGAEIDFKSLINEYPETSYAEASVKELLEIKKHDDEDFEGLKQYFETDTTILNHDMLSEIAASMSNWCNVESKAYPEAISVFEQIIQAPASIDDSICAIIDLGHTYLIMEDDSTKSAYRGELLEHIPKSLDAYVIKREELLKLLLDRSKSDNQNTDKNLNQPDLISNIYPNPVSSDLNMEIMNTEHGGYELLITDIFGKVIISRKFVSGGQKSEKISLDVSTFVPGIYNCAVKIEGRRYPSMNRIVKM